MLLLGKQCLSTSTFQVSACWWKFPNPLLISLSAGGACSSCTLGSLPVNFIFQMFLFPITKLRRTTFPFQNVIRLYSSHVIFILFFLLLDFGFIPDLKNLLNVSLRNLVLHHLILRRMILLVQIFLFSHELPVLIL